MHFFFPPTRTFAATSPAESFGISPPPQAPPIGKSAATVLIIPFSSRPVNAFYPFRAAEYENSAAIA